VLGIALGMVPAIGVMLNSTLINSMSEFLAYSASFGLGMFSIIWLADCTFFKNTKRYMHALNTTCLNISDYNSKQTTWTKLRNIAIYSNLFNSRTRGFTLTNLTPTAVKIMIVHEGNNQNDVLENTIMANLGVFNGHENSSAECICFACELLTKETDDVKYIAQVRDFFATLQKCGVQLDLNMIVDFEGCKLEVYNEAYKLGIKPN
jgi:hypothetical protein